MPPVTPHARIFYNSSLKTFQPQAKCPNNPPSPRRRRPRHSSKTYVKQSPKNSRKSTEIQKKENEQRTITYDRDALLSIRNSALSQQTPDLPPIPGVTVPKMKEKKDMPESLRQKLLKRGVVIREPIHSDDVITAAVKSLSLSDKYNDVIWQSCMHHLV